MGENEEPPKPEDLEKQKEIVKDLYKREKEERAEYLKSTEEDRKKSFEESKSHIEPTISQKAFYITKQKEKSAELKDLKPRIGSTGEAISKSVSEKIFLMEKQKEKQAQRQEMKPDIKGIGDKLESEIGKIEQKKKLSESSDESEESKSDVEKWLDQQKKLKKTD